MLDPKLLRTDPESIAAALGRRGVELDLKAYRSAEERRKTLQVESEELRGEGKINAQAVGEAKAKGEDADRLLQAGEDIKRRLTALTDELGQAQAVLDTLLSSAPNLPSADVPDGKDENDNVPCKQWGDKPEFSFEVRDHVAIAENLAMMNNEAAVKLAGGRFTVLTGDLAKLHRALIRFMLDMHTGHHGYGEVYVPYIANAESLYCTGQLPKFEEDLFALSGTDYYLVPTGEVPMTNLFRGEIIEEEALPIKLVAHTPCFRSEAGSYGKDTRGLIRQHQFEKVEMVQVVRAEKSPAALEELVQHAEAVLQALELPYQIVELCTGDLGFASARTYDLEVWLPGQQCYREISSCSNMTDFQARRMKTRVRRGKDRPELVHTLNGSGLAIGRTLVAVLENYQDEQGNVRLPSALVEYMDGQKTIGE